MADPSLYRDRLRLRHLRLLEMIQREGSLRGVAECLRLTQPAVSQMVKDLEAAFGVNLIRRSAKGADLTEAGRYALQRMQVGLATFDHLAQELTAAPLVTIRLGTNPMLASGLLPRAMRHLNLLGTSQRINVMSGVVEAMMRGVLDGSLDCYVGRVDWDVVPQPIMALMRASPLMVSQLTIVASQDHPLAGRTDLTSKSLLDWPWALPTQTTSNRASLDKAFRDCGLQPPMPVVEMVAEPIAFMALAEEIDVLTCLPQAALPDRGLVPLDIVDLHLEPIVTHFITLAETVEFPPIAAVHAALARAAKELGREVPKLSAGQSSA